MIIRYDYMGRLAQKCKDTCTVDTTNAFIFKINIGIFISMQNKCAVQLIMYFSKGISPRILKTLWHLILVLFYVYHCHLNIIFELGGTNANVLINDWKNFGKVGVC